LEDCQFPTRGNDFFPGEESQNLGVELDQQGGGEVTGNFHEWGGEWFLPPRLNPHGVWHTGKIENLRGPTKQSQSKGEAQEGAEGFKKKPKRGAVYTKILASH